MNLYSFYPVCMWVDVCDNDVDDDSDDDDDVVYVCASYAVHFILHAIMPISKYMLSEFF